MDWSIVSALAAITVVTAGALLQAATGLGAGLVIVPLLAMLSHTLIPAPVIFASLALSTLMAARGYREIDLQHMGVLVLGIAAGTVLAALALTALPIAKMGIVFGALILLAVTLSIFTPKIRLNRGGLLGVGWLAGVMGTAAGIGAPVLALLYQHHSGPQLRANLALLYFISSILMLTCLHFAGRFGTAELVSGLVLMPGFLIGYLLSSRAAGYIDRGYARPAVLVVSTVSALALIVRSLAAA